MPRAKTVKAWDKMGMSKSTYYRHRRAAKKKPPAPSVSPGDRKRQRIAAAHPPSVIERTRAQAMAEYKTRGDDRNVQTVDLGQRIGEAVDKALVSSALAQLEFMLDASGGHSVIVMHGTTMSFAACARALRKAGY